MASLAIGSAIVGLTVMGVRAAKAKKAYCPRCKKRRRIYKKLSWKRNIDGKIGEPCYCSSCGSKYKYKYMGNYITT